MTEATIYHNPRCSNLQENDAVINEVRYLEDTPSKQTLAELCQMMGVKPLQIIRTGEAIFKELGLSKTDQRSDEEWLDIMAANPKLIERPIVRIGNKAVMGRPPENVLQIL